MKRNIITGLLIFLVCALAYCYEKTYYPLPLPGQQEGPPPFLRLHVVANSNDERDQEIKLGIRDLVLGYLYSGLHEVQDYEEALNYTHIKLSDLEKRIDEKLQSGQCGYGVKGQVVLEEFPATNYGLLRFPAGQYWSLRLTLGEGQGYNWWCVLYPPMCFVDLNKSEPVSVMAPAHARGKDEGGGMWKEIGSGIKRELQKIWLSQ